MSPTYVEHVVGGVSTIICTTCNAPIRTTEPAHERAHAAAEGDGPVGGSTP